MATNTSGGYFNYFTFVLSGEWRSETSDRVPSDFGLQRMKEENALFSPMTKGKLRRANTEAMNSPKNVNKKNLSEFEFGKEGKEIDNEQLRQYNAID